MQQRTLVLLGRAAGRAAATTPTPVSCPPLSPPASGPGKRSRSPRSLTGQSSLTAVDPGSGPRTHLPFLLNVVKKATALPSTTGSPAPHRAYPQLPAGATKHAEGSTILYKDDACVVVNDAYPKSFVHCLVLPLDLSLRSLNDLRFIPAATSGEKGAGKQRGASTTRGHAQLASPVASPDSPRSNGLDHVQLLRHCDAAAQGYIAFLRKASPTLYGRRRFITGFHALPSLPMLHMHVVSMDLDSPCLKSKKHYNSFATFFFLTVDRIIDDLERNGQVTINQNITELAKMENQAMTCLWCGMGLPTIPAMKKHVPVCAKNKSVIE